MLGDKKRGWKRKEEKAGNQAGRGSKKDTAGSPKAHNLLKLHPPRAVRGGISKSIFQDVVNIWR
jgi:hypothetical protein